MFNRRVDLVLKFRSAIAAMAIVIALIFSGLPGALVGPEVEAQNTISLINNLSRGSAQLAEDHEDQLISTDGSSVTQKANKFTTGANEDGYTIEELILTMSFDGTESPLIAIYTDSSGNPGTSVFAFTNPSSLATTEWEEVTFTAPDDATLEPSTDYWIVATTTASSEESYSWEVAGATSASTETGWSLTATSKTKTGTGSWSANNSLPFRLQLKGAAVVVEDTSVVLLSNSDLADVSRGPTVAARARVGTDGGSKYEKAVPFETGSNSSGYVLTEFTTRIGYVNLSVSPQVTIYTDSNGLPGAVVTGGELTAPADPTETGTFDSTFTSSSGVTLAADTKYHAVISDSDDTNYFVPLRVAYPGATDQIVAEDGWAYTKAGLNKTDSGAWGTIPRGEETFKITIKGTVNPLPGVTVSESSLTIDEGETATYDIVLDAEPANTVTIAVASDDTNEVTVSPASLTFTTSNWDDEQTVTVTAVDDDFDQAAASATISHTATSDDTGYEGISIDDVTVTVTDDDTAGVSISPTFLSLTEGSATGDAYAIVLESAPVGGSATITPSSTNTTLSFNPASVTFDATNWDDPVTVTVTAADDDNLSDESVSISHTVTGYSASAQSISGTITDDDTASVTVSTSTLTISEGGTGTYTVVLDHQPSHSVTITPASGDTSVATVSAALTFSTTNWNQSQTVTVTAPQETDLTDTDDDSVTITHTLTTDSASDFTGASVADVTVTVEDDDEPGVTFSPSALTIEEGEMGTYTVVLNTDPGASVTITPSVTGLTFSPASLMFTSGASGTWDDEQTMTVTTPEDDDLVDDEYTISHTIEGYTGVTSGNVTVTVTDDDEAGVIVSPTELTVTEGDDEGSTYTVVLDKQPSADVVVTINRPAGTDLTISAASLTFTSSNWNAAQSVKVTAGEDDDGIDDTATISHSVSSTGDANYNAVTAASVSIRVTDIDTSGVTISPTNLPMIAEGTTAVYNVRLNTDPLRTVTIGVSPGAGSGVSVDKTSLTFNSTDWSTDQPVTVTAIQDDDAFDNSGSITHTVNGYAGVSSAPAVSVSVVDDESQGIVLTNVTTESDNSLSKTVTEGSSDQTYTVALTSKPVNPMTLADATVTVAIGGLSGTDVSVLPTSLTFTSSNWDTAQTVTITAAQDADGVDDNVTINHDPSGADYGDVSTLGLALTVSDDDSPNLVILDHNVQIAELGTVTQVGSDAVNATDTFGVKLSTEPTAEVTVSLAFESGSDSDIRLKDSLNNLVSTLSLTFTTSNWNNFQMVTVNAASDDDAVDDRATIALTASGATEYGSVTGEVPVTVNDDEVAKVIITPVNLTITEQQIVEYTVTLSARPSGTVFVSPTISIGDTAIEIDVSRVQLNASNWNTGEEIEVTAKDDDDGEDATATITHAVSGAAEFRNPTDPVPSVTVNVIDDDEKGLEFAQLDEPATQTINMDEGDTNKRYAVRLKTQPTGVVQVVPSLPSGSRLEFTDTSPGKTFNPTGSNDLWSAYQTIGVNALQDDDALDNTFEITHGISGYGTLETMELPEPIIVNVKDDDTASVEVTIRPADEDSDGNLVVNEGDAAGTSFSVVLTSLPVNPMTGSAASVNMTITATGGLTVVGGLHSFGAGSWDDPRTITIRATDDDNGVDEDATISIAITGVSDYAAVTVDDIPVKIVDNDPVGLSITPTNLTNVDEGSTTGRTYTIKPDTEPSAEFTVSISSDNPALNVSPASMTFDGSDWRIPKRVTVTAVQDEDAFDDTATITHTTTMTTGEHQEYHELEDGVTPPADVSVTAADDDTQGVNVSTTALTVNEGGSSTYTITLDTLPVDSNGDPDTVTIAIAPSTDSADITNTSSVTLNSSNWELGATVTVSVAEDADTTAETETLEHTVTGADYAGQTVSDVVVTANDNDTAGVSISESTLTPTEGGTATYTVVLNTQPTGNVTVTANSNNPDLTLSSTSLTFTSSTWDTAQTVTVTAAEDADAQEDMATITHSASGAEYQNLATQPASISVTVTENDALAVNVSPTTLAITEVDGGTASGTYTVELEAAPTGGAAIIELTVTGDSDVSVSPTSLTFNASEWTATTTSISKTVTVNVDDDEDATSPETATIEHSIAGSSDYATTVGIVTDDVVVTVTDTDTRGVSPSTTDVTVAEGSTSTYTLVLDTRPTGDVVVTIIDPTDNVVFETDPASLTFTAVNWNQPQTVTVRALADDDANDDTGTVTHTVSGADYSQTPAISIDDVAVTSTDGNTRGVRIVTTADPYLTGEGLSITYQVRLETEPSGTVTITPASTTSELSFNPTSLSFDDSDWNSLKAMQVNVGQDDDAAAETATVTHSVTGADYGANNVTAGTVNLDIADDDEANVVVPVTTLDVTEGSSAGYTIALGSRPVGGDVTITIAVSGSPDITVGATELTFTADTWTRAQLVTVSAADDSDTREDTGVIRHTVSGANFEGATIDNIAVTVIEDDMAMITIEPIQITIGEGKSATYTVVLGTEPSGDVTIRAASDNSDVTLSPSTLTFKQSADPGEGQWDEPQVVTATASDDTDAVNDTAAISHTASGNEYEGEIGPTVTVTVVEDGSDVRNTSSFLRSASCDSNLSLTWNSPVEGSTIASYVIHWAVSGSEYNATDFAEAPADSTSWTIESLDNDVRYKVRVQALDDTATPIWSREITAMPSDKSCIDEVRFGNILADSTPVIVEVEEAEEGTQVNVRYRSLNPGVWSEVLSQILGEGEDSATFDIRGLKPDNPYEVQAWLGSATPPTQLDDPDAVEASVAQTVFTTGALPEGATFTGGGGSRGGRILRIEPAILSVAVRSGDEVLLSVDVWGRQNILDNGLADRDARRGRPEFTWFSDAGGSFSEANIRSEWQNGLADDRLVMFTAPGHAGTVTITASLEDSFLCLAAGEGETAEDQLARCTAQIEVTVLRRAAATISTTAPVNPPGPIPETLTDSEGVAYAIFTPVEGGSFVGDGYSLTAGPGAVANGEFIGLSMTPAGDASNAGMTWHRYAFAGRAYSVGVVDAAGEAVSGYSLGEPAMACIPMPDDLRANLTDVVLTASTNEQGFTVLTTSVKISPDGIQVCGKLSTVPAEISTARVGRPASADDGPVDVVEEETLPETGGTSPASNLLLTLFILGSLAALIGIAIVIEQQRRPIAQRGGRVRLNVFFIGRNQKKAPALGQLGVGASRGGQQCSHSQ